MTIMIYLFLIFILLCVFVFIIMKLLVNIRKQEEELNEIQKSNQFSQQSKRQQEESSETYRFQGIEQRISGIHSALSEIKFERKEEREFQSALAELIKQIIVITKKIS